MPQDSHAPDTSIVYIYDSIDGTEYFIPQQILGKDFYQLDKAGKHTYLIKKYNPIYDTSYRQSYIPPNEEPAHESFPTAVAIVTIVAVALLYFGLKILPGIDSKKITGTKEYKIFLISCFALFFLGIYIKNLELIVPTFIILIIAAVISGGDDVPEQPQQNEYVYSTPEETIYSPNQLVYYGNELNFSLDILKTVLTKHFPYYNTLDGFQKDKFLHRLQKFIESKTFIIHDESGFREMPILISAAAIQLSFGFEKYLLPGFPNINIYPEEFLGIHPFIRYLEGNVSDSNINISWKHFLNGFQCPTDGQNVGLHEMAHAYHFQNFETGHYEDEDFISNFPKFNNYANKAFEQEAIPGNDLYSDYALKNFQEFWAESVEIFFEKPLQLKSTYPDLFIAMCDLLNQQPC